MKRPLIAMMVLALATGPTWAEDTVAPIAENQPQTESEKTIYPKPAQYEWNTTKNPIQRVTEANLMAGYPDGQFHAEGKLTRAELAHILVKAFKLTSRDGNTNIPATHIKDVPAGHWAYTDIETVLRTNIMTGYKTNYFYPDREVTRGEAFAIFAQAYGVFNFKPEMVKDVLSQYRDAKEVPAWADKAMATALHEGFVNTNELSGYIYPSKPMTRGDMAFALDRYLQRTYNKN